MKHFYRLIIVVNLLLISSTILLAQNPAFKGELTYSITEGNDDAEERADGSMYTNSTDLELVYDRGDKQIIGLRFSGIELVQGAKVDSAFIQFTCKKENSNTTTLRIKAELNPNALAFVEEDNNLSNRPRTSNTVMWSVSPWKTIGAALNPERSPNLKDLITEVISQPHWEHGNAIAFIIDGEGEHNAASFENKTLDAASLVIYTSFEAATNPILNVRINEIQPSESALLDELGEADDWFEIYNANDTAVYIGGLFFSDDINELQKWQLKNPLTLEPKGYQLFWADNDEEQGTFHTNFKLKKEGETLYLAQYHNMTIIIIDSLNYDTVPKYSSVGRLTETSDSISLFGLQTPGYKNAENALYLSKPLFSRKQGIYSDSIAIEITSTQDSCIIYYTLDGSLPTDTAFVYTEPIVIDSGTVIKAICSKSGYAASSISSAFYCYDIHKNIPVVHLTIDPFYLWDDSLGMYVKGTNGIPIGKRDSANWSQEWVREGKIFYQDLESGISFSQKTAVEIGGHGSRYQAQKSFNVHFREPYTDKQVKEKIFANRDTKKYKHLKIRNGGQDFKSIMFRDGVNHLLAMDKLDIDVMAYRPVVLYLNGKYWGVYGLRESFTDEYINTYHNVKKDSLTIVYGTGAYPKVDKGTNVEFSKFYNFANNNDLSIDANYKHIDSLLNISSYIDYLFAEIYLSNYDWPGNNKRMWMERPSGKWHYMLYDTDISANSSNWDSTFTIPNRNTLEFVTSETSTKWPNSKNANILLRKLFKNNAFAGEFSQRAQTYMYTVFDSTRTDQIIDSIFNLVEPEIHKHINKWTQEYPEWGSSGTCGGSYEAWTNNINNYQLFFRQRPYHFTEHIKSYFEVTKMYNLHLNFDDNSNGSITLHNNNFVIPSHFENNYFSEYPLQVAAIADSGYQFVKWLETGDTSATLHFTSNNDAVLTPIFEENVLDHTATAEIKRESFFRVYPNPIVNYSTTLSIGELVPNSEYTVQIINVMGKIVNRSYFRADNAFHREVLNLQGLRKGNYLIQVSGGSIRKSQKISIL